MSKIFVTSDLHFCHDRDWLYKPRGFSSVTEMNEALVQRWNEVVSDEDDVFVIGDMIMDDLQTGIKLVNKLYGKIHLIIGNHDTDKKVIEMRKRCPHIVEYVYATMIRYKKMHLFLSHRPCLNDEWKHKHLSDTTICLYGHIHQQHNFYQDNPIMYHVGVDSHNCTPVLIENVIADIRKEYVKRTNTLKQEDKNDSN